MALTGSQTISGDKTFSGAVINDGDLYLKQDATYIPKSGYTNLFASGKTVNINFGSTINAVLDFTPLSSDKTYTFPNASGTIALTSDIPSLAGYVPTSRTITINGTTFDLSADRSYTIATGTGTVTSVAALTLGTSGTDLSSSVANGTTTPVITLNVPTASATNRGALSAADWTTFNNKQAALGYTAANDANVVHTTGNESISGVKTFTTAVHSNILKFSESAGFNQTAGYTQIGGTADYFAFANGGNTKSAQFNYNGASAIYTLPATTGTLALTSELHNAVTIGTANGLSLSTQVLSLALASTSTTGALSSTDWNTFNGKQNALTNPVTGTGTTSYLPKFTGTSTIGNSLLYDTGSALLVGATSASDAQSKLELVSASTVGLKIISSGANGNNTFLSIQASKEWRFVTNRGDLISGNQGDLIIRNNTDGINHIILNQGGSTTFYGALSGTSATFTNPFTNNINIAQTSGSTTLGHLGQFADSLYISNNYFYNGAQSYDDTSKANSSIELTTGSILLKTGAANTVPSTKVTITTFGNVGINTTSPGYKLHLLGGNEVGSRFIVTGTYAPIQFSGDNGTTLGGLNAFAGDIYLGRGTATGTQGDLKISSSGAATFANSVSANIIFSNTDFRTDGGTVKVGAGSNNYYTQMATAYIFPYIDSYFDSVAGASYEGRIIFRTSSGGGSLSPRMTITNGGEVLINSTSPRGGTIKLYVNGTLRVGDDTNPIFSGAGQGAFSIDYPGITAGRLNLDNNGALTIRGALTQNASDERLKNNIKTIPDALKKVLLLRGVTFDWNTDIYESGRTTDIGVIAQDVKNILPDAVALAPFDRDIASGKSLSGKNYLTVYYEKLIPLLIESVKELKAELDILKNK
jgi:hypothetical protein